MDDKTVAGAVVVVAGLIGLAAAAVVAAGKSAFGAPESPEPDAQRHDANEPPPGDVARGRI